MEKFTFKKEGMSPKILKLLTLVIGIGLAETSFALEKIGNLEEFVDKAKKIELSLAESAAQNGELSLLNNLHAATLNNGSSIVQVVYSDETRTNPSNFLIAKEGKYYWDGNADGQIDGVYVDKNNTSQEMPSKQDLSQIRLSIVAGGPSQAELDLADMMKKNFIYFNVSGEEYKIFDTSDQSISKVTTVDDKQRVIQNLQTKFLGVLDSQ